MDDDAPLVDFGGLVRFAACLPAVVVPQDILLGYGIKAAITVDRQECLSFVAPAAFAARFAPGYPRFRF